MFCPSCGFPLIIAEPSEPKDINWNLIGEDLQVDIQRYKDEHEHWDRSQKCTCTNPKCSYGDMLRLHHPFCTTRERGDDSWSISYIN